MVRVRAAGRLQGRLLLLSCPPHDCWSSTWAWYDRAAEGRASGAQAVNVSAVALHTVWTSHPGLDTKRGRLQESLLWRGESDGSAYLADGRFLSVDVAWPKAGRLSPCSVLTATTRGPARSQKQQQRGKQDLDPSAKPATLFQGWHAAPPYRTLMRMQHSGAHSPTW